MSGIIAGAAGSAYSLLTAVADPNSIDGFGGGGNPELVTSTDTTATPTGGLAPYTYDWEYVSGDSVNPTADTSATTAFQNLMPTATVLDAVWRCKVTDAVGHIAYTNNVSIHLDN